MTLFLRQVPRSEPQSDKNLIQVPRSEPRSSKKKKGAIHSPKYRSTTKQKKRGSRNLTKRCPEATFEEMGEDIKSVHTSTPSENTDNKTRSRIERNGRGSDTENPQEKNKVRNPEQLQRKCARSWRSALDQGR